MPQAAGWSIGDRILDRYEVLAVHGRGGMGLVHRVRHLGWRLDLAVKSPRPEWFADDEDRRRFVREAETWVSLGVHPNLCACHYVRTVDGIPRVFAEYVDGGSLREWIDDGRLYQGGPRVGLARILDIAVQMAWGMAHAHGRGVVHQDLKPGNVLLDTTGTAKVTDFGLARVGRPRARRGGDATILVTVGGMTPAYASPEQLGGGRAGRRTDVWSLAVTVLEMFTGRVTWTIGPAAVDVLDSPGAGAPGRPSMPPALVALLGRCLSFEPSGRPAGMAVLADELIGVYEQECGPYPRPAPRSADLRADELTNRALSLLDLDRTDEARQCFDEALAADPRHVGATWNSGLLAWRTGRITDEAFLARLDEVGAYTSAEWPVRQLIAEVHRERGSDPGTARIGGCRHVLDGHTGHVDAVVVTADARRALSAGRDGTVRIWDLDAGRCLHVLDEHTGAVTAVAVTADGSRALSAGADGSVRYWDVAAGRCLRVLDGHSSRVTSVAVTADGTRAISGCVGGTLWVWDLSSGHGRCVLDDHPGVQSVALTGDGRLALAAGYRDVRLYDLDTGRHLAGLPGGPHGVALVGGLAYSSSVPSVALADDGRLALAVDDRIVRVWDLDSGGCVRVFDGHSHWVHSMAVSPDGRLAVSCGADETLRVWQPATARCVRTFTGHDGIVSSAAINEGATVAVSGGADGTVRVWDLPDPGLLRCTFRPCRPRSHTELTAGEARLTELLAAARSAAALSSATLSSAAASSAAASSAAASSAARHGGRDAAELLREARELPGYERDPRVMAAWRELSRVSSRLGVRDIWQSRVLETAAEAISVVRIGPDGRVGLSGGGRTVRVWEIGGVRRLHTFAGHPIGVGDGFVVITDLLSPVSGQAEGTIRILDAVTGRELHALEGHRARWATLTPDGRMLVSGAADGAVRVWDTTSGRRVRDLAGAGAAGTGFLFSLQGHTYSGVVRAVAALPGGERVLAGGDDGDGRLREWDLVTGACLRTFRGHHSGAVRSIATTPDGRLALSAGGRGDATVRVWDLITGECRHTLRGHSDSVAAVVVTADGSVALSAGGDGLRSWDPSTGRSLHTLDGKGGRVRTLAMSPDGNHAYSGGDDGTVREWEIDWELGPVSR
ncbi:WD40 repeat domain-containing serine/threonine protein kinase [Actinoplanes subglobosus]|uniref:WD40 repeat domain-containing serine/threonine protein kinase n=1 Tax=Actinoplanes subglobosus TaxID=1547892 RepID=A0ABV8J1C4_9ACTN